MVKSFHICIKLFENGCNVHRKCRGRMSNPTQLFSFKYHTQPITFSQSHLYHRSYREKKKKVSCTTDGQQCPLKEVQKFVILSVYNASELANGCVFPQIKSKTTFFTKQTNKQTKQNS